MARGSFLIPFGSVAHVVLAWGVGAPSAAASEPIAPAFADLAGLADGQPHPDGESAYTANAYKIIHVGRDRTANGDGAWWRPVRGEYRISLEHDAFFASLGRADLAEQYRHRHFTGRTLEIAGYVSACVGAVVTPWLLFQRSWIAAASFGVFAGGIWLRGIGEDMQKPTLPEDDALEMAARYNRALRVHLGLPPLSEPGNAPATKPPPSSFPGLAQRRSGRVVVAFAPLVGPGAVGALLAGRF